MSGAAPLPPDGIVVFLDANILFYHLVSVPDLSEWSSELLLRITAGRISGVTSAHVVAETIHKVMASEASMKFSLPRPAIVNYLRHNPLRIAELSDFVAAATDLQRIGLPLLSIDTQLIIDATAISTTHGMFTNDAITVALMRRYGLSHIATNDDDFKHTPDLTVWTPRPA